MNPQDRQTLKNYFSDGALPTAQHYSELVDSMITWKDDGFDKSQSEGWRIASVGDDRALMSFYRGIDAPEADWTLAHGPVEGTLVFRPGAAAGGPDGQGPNGTTNGAATDAGGAASGSHRGLCLTREGRIGISRAAPDWQLDVDGVARMRGRIGVPRPGQAARVPADGTWHDITDTLEGCHMVEVVAGAGGTPGRGRYALVHATALNAYNPRNPLLNWIFGRKPIRCQSAVFGNYADRISLRWSTPPRTRSARARGDGQAGRRFNRPYTLQIRTNARYGDGHFIRYYVTRLWFDSTMEGSRRPDVDRDDGVA